MARNFTNQARAALLLAGLATFSAGPALADVKAGVDAWSNGDYAQAVVEWQGPAAQGDPDALFNLAQAYRLGRGVEADSSRARRFYEQAADKGHIKAADNYGLLLFQEGEQQKAMPLIRAAAERGDPRAQYVLGLSHFNADFAPRDWVRAYALMTLSNSSGLPQAAEALAQMDKFVPQAQRSQAQSLAREIDTAAQRQRASDLAAAELASTPAAPPAAFAAAPGKAPAAMTQVAAAPAPVSVPAPAPAAATAPAFQLTRAPAPAQTAPLPAAARGGNWRIQLGAFGVPANAERLWNQLSGNPALSGTRKALVPSGKLTRLLATGFASQGEAASACARLKQQGQACLVAGQG